MEGWTDPESRIDEARAQGFRNGQQAERERVIALAELYFLATANADENKRRFIDAIQRGDQPKEQKK